MLRIYQYILVKSHVFHNFRSCGIESWKISYIVNAEHIGFYLIFTHVYYIIDFFLQKSRNLFSTTYISVVIDCIFIKKAASV